ncbi:UPF0496 protein At1g20180-like [Vicia villosa]|uniref:UPF0496 protein At1g20180-like n=1 Tax=Vicia villosa TaxID=3911 RepID=UPI00273BA5FD|nr:UPF0496 protein At1g20180-like [Vicia villosa]
MTCTRWLCSFQRSGRSRKECVEEDSLCKKPNVNEEYLQTFRTNSYMEICNKAQASNRSRLSSSCSTSSLPICMNLTESLLEPRQEIITNMTQNFKVHHLIVDYFNASLDACRCCDIILEGIHSTRLSYTRITRVVTLSKNVLNEFNDSTNGKTKKDIHKEVASFSSKLQNNRLSVISTMQFRDNHDRFIELLQRLTSKREKIKRKLALIRVCKKVGGIALVTSHGAILNAAAKGVFIMINDLDTMSRMVKRVNDEVEHKKMVADVCVKNVGSKCEILKQVMNEFSDYESRFLEQLEELEEHVYLCFLTVNKSRRLVMQQII